jgi:glycosyltransferase involved in cell wall biosynthesis
MSQSLHTASAFQSTRAQSAQSSGTGTLPVRSDSRGQHARATTLKVCIIGLKCFDHLADKPIPQFLGGIETQMAVLAKGLRDEGCEVSLITFDHGQRDEEIFHGVKALKSFAPTGGIRGVRGFTRARKLWQAMCRADADIYLQMGAGSETGLVALGCKFKSGRARRFVFCLASDADCEGPIGAKKIGLEMGLYRYGIKRASLIISQTTKQKTNLESSLGLKSRIIPMAVADVNTSGERRANHVLWVGRLMSEKRFEWLLEAARRCPEMEFHVAGTPNQPSGYAAELMAAAAKVPNVRAHGRISRAELDNLFQSCGLLCCTSMLEGFPTTFLEAWRCGLPVVTTFDPDNIVARECLGKVVNSVDELISQLRELPKTEAYARMSVTAKNFFVENYSVETVSRQFRLAFEEIVGQ